MAIDQVTMEFGEFDFEYEEVIGAPPPLPAPPMGEVFTAEHLAQGSYTQYLIDSRYRTDTGNRVLPKAGSANDAALRNSVVQIHRGITTLEIVWTVERQNAKPLLPKSTLKDANCILETAEITLANKYQLTNNNVVYRASGIYLYKLLIPKTPDSKYPIGTTPAEISPSAANFFGPEDFKDTFLDAAFAAPQQAVVLQIPIRVGP